MISEKKSKLYCKEDISLIENYEEAVNDPINKWVIHHRRGTIYSMEGLKEIGEYYKRPAIELIFMLKEEHNRFHSKGNQRHLGKRHSEKSKKQMSKAHYKPIIQYTKDGEFIKEWTSGIEASRALNIYGSNICCCCQGKRKSAGGFVWRYR